MFGIAPKQCVLLIWKECDPEELRSLIEKLKADNSEGKLHIENVGMLKHSSYSSSSFDVVLLDVLRPHTIEINQDILCEILVLLKPSGKLSIFTDKIELVTSSLKLCGFTNICELSSTELHSCPQGCELSEIVAFKPDFEVGSSVQLSFCASDTWRLNLDENKLENPDDLLTEEDRTHPDPSSLKVCGSTGKRKACKNCVCGLKEELEAEETAKINKDFKPSCGSCYLGDAFRCASCPYLGMPAFEPGEKVKLSSDTLQDDL